MSETQKTQRTFMAITMLAVIALTAVFIAYAALLATYTGTTVIVNQMGGTMQYNLSNNNNGTWASSLSAMNNGTAWYARINVTGAAQQSVTINWVLQKYTTSWTDQSTPVTTNIILAVGDNTIYATDNGVFSGNFNWGSLTTASGSYRVEARVNG